MDVSKALKELDERYKGNAAQRMLIFKEIARMPGGIEFFNWIFELGQLYEEPFTGSSDTYWRLGAQRIARTICEELKRADLGIYMRCEEERIQHGRYTERITELAAEDDSVYT